MTSVLSLSDWDNGSGIKKIMMWGEDSLRWSIIRFDL